MGRKPQRRTFGAGRRSAARKRAAPKRTAPRPRAPRSAQRTEDTPVAAPKKRKADDTPAPQSTATASDDSGAAPQQTKKKARTEPPPEPEQPQLRWKPLTSISADARKESRAQIIAAIQAFFNGITGIVKYDMKGAQSAKTTVTIGGTKVYKTESQMHSEMRAINGTPSLRRLHRGMVRNRVDPAKFSTTEPHCGYCTFFLKVLNLPLTKPTRGLFNQAANCDYPLPAALKYDQAFISRVCGFDTVTKKCARDLVEMINQIYVSTGTASWADIAARKEVLNDLWRQIFGCLNATL